MQPKKRKIQSSLPTLLTSQTEIAEAGEKLRQEELLGSGAFAAVYLCSLDGQPRAKKVVSDIAQFEAEQKALKALSGYNFIVQLFQPVAQERTVQMCFTRMGKLVIFMANKWISQV
jgi:predicted Ser/Thr protein kinase